MLLEHLEIEPLVDAIVDIQRRPPPERRQSGYLGHLVSYFLLILFFLVFSFYFYNTVR
jgi:hypothetical protein